MIASSWLDPVLGVDIHWEMVPTPAPVPTPIPNPFVGIVFDPGGLIGSAVMSAAMSAVFGAPFQGPVLHCVFPMTNTGTEAKHIPGHIIIPPGTIWAPVPRTPKPKVHPGDKPSVAPPVKPENDAVCILGSKTVEIGGSNAVRLGDILLSCSEPVRLPSSVVLAIPKGAPVLIGGPPSLDIASAVMASLRTRFMSDSLHALMSRIPFRRVRNLARRAVCFFTGHPVDVASGKVMTSSVDAELPGPLPLKIERVYSSAFGEREGPLGRGWSLSLDQGIWTEPGKVVLLEEDGREVEFDTFDLAEHRMRPGDEVWQPMDRLTLRCLEHGRWQVVAHDGVTREFAPVPGRTDGRAMIQRARSRCGFHEILYEYDKGGRLEWVRDACGRLIWLESDREGRVVALKLPVPSGDGWYVHRRYAYDRGGDLVRVTDALKHAWRFEYVTHLLVRETDRTGLSFFFEYDGLGEDAWCTRTWGDGGIYDHTLAYDKVKKVTFVTDSLGHTTQYHMNLVGQVVKVVGPLQAETKYEYDPRTLQKTAEIDALGHARRWEYDELGRVRRTKKPNGVELVLEYQGSLSRPSRLAESTGRTWTWQYEDTGLLSWREDPAGRRTQYAHDDRGRVVARVDPDGCKTIFEYDAGGNLGSQAVPGRHVDRWSYDALGRPIKHTDWRGNVRRRVYDLEGRVIQHRTALGISCVFSHDEEGRLLHSADGRREVVFTRQGRGRIATRTEGDTTVRFAYDTEERLVCVANELGRYHRYLLGPSGFVDEEVDFDGRTRRYHRDANGQVVRVDRPNGRVTTLVHDEVGQVTAVKHSDGTWANYEYSLSGELSEASNESSTVVFERDVLGRILREVQLDHWVSSSYGASGRRNRVSSSWGSDQYMEYNDAGDVTLVSHVRGAGDEPFEVRFARNEAGVESDRWWSGGLHCSRDSDAARRPLRQTVTAGQSLKQSLDYRWGASGSLEAVHDSMFGATRLRHDSLGALVGAEYSDGEIELRVCDAVDNLYRTGDRSDRDYGPSGQLLAAREGGGTTNYLYDEEGNLVEKRCGEGDAWKYTWNDAGMLVSASRSDGTVVTFAYDPLGRRISKTCGDRTTRWVWDCNVPLHEWEEDLPSEPSSEKVAAHPTTWLFQPGTFAPLAKITRSECNPIVTDHLGTPAAMFAADGTPVWGASQGAWGQVREHRGAKPSVPFRRPGQYEDEETGLHYNRWRYYDPEAGTFLSKDPLGLQTGPRPYGYVQDPWRGIDPLGLTDENATGWGVYVIADKATGTPIYVGNTNDFVRRADEHARNVVDGVPRYDPGTQVFVPVLEDVTYGEARGAEQALMEDLGTKVKSERGTFPSNVIDSVAAHRLDEPSTVREEVFSAAYDKHKGVTVDTAKEKIDAACHE